MYIKLSMFLLNLPFPKLWPFCAIEGAGTRRISLSPLKILAVERDTLYLHARSFNSRGTSSATEESLSALASARCLVIMHHDLPDLDSQGGNWFYNLKQAYTHAVIEAEEIPHCVAHACSISYARARRPFTNHFPWLTLNAFELVPRDSIGPTPYYIKRGEMSIEQFVPRSFIVPTDRNSPIPSCHAKSRCSFFVGRWRLAQRRRARAGKRQVYRQEDNVVW